MAAKESAKRTGAAYRVEPIRFAVDAMVWSIGSRFSRLMLRHARRFRARCGCPSSGASGRSGSGNAAVGLAHGDVSVVPMQRAEYILVDQVPNILGKGTELLFGAVFTGIEQVRGDRDGGSDQGMAGGGGLAFPDRFLLCPQKSVGLPHQAAFRNRRLITCGKAGRAISWRIMGGTFSKEPWASCSSLRTVSTSIWAKRASRVDWPLSKISR